MPLRGIPNEISPELLKTLAEMGHGDEIILADAHFPTASICTHGPRHLRADGLGAAVLLRGIMKLLPLDQYVDCPVARMELVPSDQKKNLPTPIWDTYQSILDEAENSKVKIEYVERFAFYDRAKTAFAIVHTGETQQYANIILKKGCLI
ncbi:L-fucose mutarotase [Plakobranchus ocellatus]|uniref:L-fucose mutarotase n=1 Tax=Plakobranchus ocellatus TaxID=259542 RepID=A0AAV4A7T1_9GAST|nr:L-fucose mutarotase [Plakobranchus ocellatus]